MRSLFLAAAVILGSTTARAEIKVMDTEDVLRLVSGEEIRGTVLAVGLRAVIVVVDDKERTVPREQVESIIRGEASPAAKYYATEVVEGLSVVTGPGTGESEGEEGVAEEVMAAGSRGRNTSKTAKRAPGGRQPALPNVSDREIEKLMQGNPGLRDIVKSVGGSGKAREWLMKNRSRPEIAKLIQQFLKSGKLPAWLFGK